MWRNCIIILTIVFSVISCDRGRRADRLLEAARCIEADTVKISAILHINNIIKLEDYIVLQNGSDGVDDFYFVYSIPELEFLYSFARRGRGPEESMMPSVIKNTPGNILGFRDHGNDKLVYYRVTDTSAELVYRDIFRSPDNDRFFWELNRMGDSLYLVKHQGYKRGMTELWSSVSGRKDSIHNTFYTLPWKLGHDYYTVFDDYMISSSGNRFARSYFMIDRIEFGEVKDGRICMVSSTGAESAPRFHLYGDDTDTEFSIDRNTIYYENMYACRDNIYALYSGRRLDETEKRHSSIVEIYSWDGRLVEILSLEVPVAYIAVDEENRIIYGVNPELSDEYILIYRY